jgi:hypothetical protein
MLLLQTTPTLSSASLAAGIALLLAACSRPAQLPLDFAPAAMSPTGPHSAAQDGSVVFRGEGALHIRLWLDRGPLEIRVEARSAVVGGEAPRLEARLDGAPVGSARIDSDGLQTYVLSAAVGRSAETALDLVVSGPGEGGAAAGRALHVRRVSVWQP